MRALQPDSTAPATSASAGLLLAQLGRGATELFRHALSQTGLKPPHVAALMKLRTAPIGQQALGEVTGLDAVKLVGILNDLETAGLVERRRDCVDRRRHIVAITCAGRARVADIERLSAIAEERLLTGLGAAQREQLAGLLRLVIETSKLGETCPGATDPDPEPSGLDS